MRTQSALVLAVALAMTVPAGARTVAAGQADSAPGPRLQLSWSHTFPARQDPVGVDTAPDRSVVLLSPRHHGRGLHVARYSHRGHEMWDQGWIGSTYPAVRSVLGEATAVSGPRHAVLIAGHATCRGDEYTALGPVFIRKYTLQGSYRWTRWIGTCPGADSQRRVPPLSVSGLDVLGNHVAVSYTQGYSWDCCVHHRKGHVALLRLDGSEVWRTRLDFPIDRLSEVVTNDVALSPGSVTVGGEVMWGSHGADAFLTSLSRSSGSVRWQHVVSGQSEPNNDSYSDLDTTGSVIYASGMLDNAFEGGGSRGFVERWSTGGARAWRVLARPGAAPAVAALPDGGVRWSKPVWKGKGESPALRRAATTWRARLAGQLGAS